MSNCSLSMFAKVLLLLSVVISSSTSVRVCKSWLDYPNPFSDNCFDNPDGIPANVTQILQRWGCTVEEHQLLTDDGYYILVVQAVMGTITKPTPIVMAHGIQMNSLGFVTMFNKSIAYHLLQEGHQIFLINFRGTRYSAAHKNLTQDDEAYWKFSFHHMAIYDIPVALDLVANESDGEKAIILAFSMGTSAANIYAISYPEEAANRLLGIIEMAPIANLTGIRSIARSISPLWPLLKPLANIIWHGRLLPINEQRNKFCSGSLLGLFACSTLNALVFGPHYSMLDPLYLPVSLQQNPDVISSMVVDHYQQILESNQFQYYDYGREKNLVEYRSTQPPRYDFSKMPVPVALLSGLNDYLSETKNARVLYQNLPLQSRCGLTIIADKKWPHNGFIISKDMPLYLHEVVSRIVVTMESNSCNSTST